MDYNSEYGREGKERAMPNRIIASLLNILEISLLLVAIVVVLAFGLLIVSAMFNGSPVPVQPTAIWL